MKWLEMKLGAISAAALLIATAVFVAVGVTKRKDSVSLSSAESLAVESQPAEKHRPRPNADLKLRGLVTDLSGMNESDRSEELRKLLKGIQSHRDALAWLEILPGLEELFGAGSDEVKAAVFAIAFHLEDAKTAMELASDHLDGEQLQGLSSTIVDAALSRADGQIPNDLYLMLNPGTARTGVVRKMAGALASKDPASVVSWIANLPLADEQSVARLHARAQLQHEIIQTGDPDAYGALAALLESGGYGAQAPGEIRAVARRLRERRPPEELRAWVNSFSNEDLRLLAAEVVAGK